jgi:hypothetical protein
LAFIASGAALGSWFAAFRLIGAALVLIGLVILVLAGWKPLQAHLQEILGPRASHHWLGLVLGMGLIAMVLLVAAFWWRVSPGWGETLRHVTTPEAEPTPPPRTEPTISCIEAAASCVMTAEMREPGNPLLWMLPLSLTRGQGDGILKADVRLAGDVAGRYVALACRSTGVDGEYVLAVRPENRSFRLIRWDGQTPTDLAAKRLTETINPANEVNHLDLRCEGSRIAALINGTPVATAVDNHYPDGGWYVATGVFMENTQPAKIDARFEQITMQPKAPVQAGPAESPVRE